MIYFIRHGESEANVRHVFAGQKDNSHLTEKGIEQAKVEGKKIKEIGLKIDTIISSPLIRAFDTAKIVSEIIGYDKEIIIDPRITEYDMGSLTGTPTHEISSKILVSAENAEDPKLFYKRISDFLNEWNKNEKNILMVCHAGVGRIIESIKQGADPELFYDFPAYSNAAIIKLDWLI
jgi:probable phosphoglycerate mutase